MIDEIENITMAEFFSLPAQQMQQQYDLLRNLRESDVLSGHKAEKMDMQPYSVIVKLKKLLQQQTAQTLTQVVELVFKISREQQIFIRLTDYFPALNYIVNGTEQIARMEMNRLSSPPRDELLASGIERMNAYGDLVTIDTLAGGDILKWSQVEAMPWRYIFTKLCMEKDRAEIQDNVDELMRSKSNNNNAHS